jgi:hypothetical protein
MAKLFTRERFGAPQAIAAALLFAFLVQCSWFILHAPLNQIEAGYIQSGLLMLKGSGSAGDQYRSPIVSLLSAAPVSILVNREAAASGGTFWPDQFYLDQHRWLIRAPFLLMGLLLGASLWYVARRLFGNPGGYVALVMYVFSPVFIARSSLAGPQIAAAWGAFGTIFTAIAVAHTLYAPREVILWNWRRILLLGVAIALMLGAQFSTVILLPVALAFMWWAVPHRRLAATVILAASVGVAMFLLLASYMFRFADFAAGLAHAQWFPFSGSVAAMPVVYRLNGMFLLRDSPAISLMFLIAIVAFVAWRRPRFFGTAAPLIVFAVLLAGALTSTQGVGLTFIFVALTFLMVFVAGVFSDLLESKHLVPALGVSIGILGAHAMLSIIGLVQLVNRR